MIMTVKDVRRFGEVIRFNITQNIWYNSTFIAVLLSLLSIFLV